MPQRQSSQQHTATPRSRWSSDPHRAAMVAQSVQLAAVVHRAVSAAAAAPRASRASPLGPPCCFGAGPAAAVCGLREDRLVQGAVSPGPRLVLHPRRCALLLRSVLLLLLLWCVQGGPAAAAPATAVCMCTWIAASAVSALWLWRDGWQHARSSSLQEQHPWSSTSGVGTQ